MMEVISPSIATMATPQTTDLGELKAKIASLRRQLSNLQATELRRSNRRTQSGSRSPSLHTSMHQAGKRSSQQLETMSIAGHTQSRLFYIPDRASGLKFLINKGAKVSVVPCSHTHRKNQKVPAYKPLTTLQLLHIALVR